MELPMDHQFGNAGRERVPAHGNERPFGDTRMHSYQQRFRKGTQRRCPLAVEELESRVVPSVLPQPAHVVLVIEENHSSQAIVGNPNAPYINSLIQRGALMTEATGVEHPSQPNYLDLFSGNNQGTTGTDDRPAGLPFSTPNLGAELLGSDAGFTFTGYSESLPSVGFDGDSFTTVPGQNQYQRKHNPWADFVNNPVGANQLPSSVNQPFTSFPTDFTQLPTLSIVVPNEQHDMHDGTVQQGDSWLHDNLDGYVQFAMTHNSLLVVTFDENDLSPGNFIPTFFVGPMVKPGSYNQPVDHFSVLRTLEDLYGLPHAGQSANAIPITSIWQDQLQFSAAAFGGVTDSGGSVDITVNRTGGAAGTVTVNYATSDGSATAGKDYAATSGTLTFNAGETSKTFTIPVLDDPSVDGDETVNLTLSNPTGGATLGSPSTAAQPTATLTIFADNSQPTPAQLQFSLTLPTVAETGGSATLSVTRTDDTSGTVTVDFATSDGTAVAGTDYTATSGTITFSPGDVSHTITVPVLHDNLPGSDKTVNLSLSNPTGGATLGLRSTSILTITETDNLTPTQSFVNQAYLRLLGRTADPGALSFWTHQITAGFVRSTFAFALITSAEGRKFEINQLFNQLVGRNADPGAVSSGTAFLNGGGSRELLASVIVSSPEYFAVHGGTAQGFFNGLFTGILGRPLGQTLPPIDVSTVQARQVLALSVLQSTEGLSVLVKSYYQQALSITQPDAGGLAFWVSLLQRTPPVFDEAVLATMLGFFLKT
jgi:hypothetical protein